MYTIPVWNGSVNLVDLDLHDYSVKFCVNHLTSYRNEEEVGSAIRKSGLPREEVFITTKVI